MPGGHRHSWTYAFYDTRPPYEARRCKCGKSEERIAAALVLGVENKPGPWRPGRSDHRGGPAVTPAPSSAPATTPGPPPVEN